MNVPKKLMDPEKGNELDELSALLDFEEQQTASAKTPPSVQPVQSVVINPSKSKTLHDFDIFEFEEGPSNATGLVKTLPSISQAFNKNSKAKTHDKSEIHKGDTDSSDDEDLKHAGVQKYTETGKTINNLMKKQTTPISNYSSNSTSWKSKQLLFAPSASSTLPRGNPSKDIYTDPFFGIRIITPLISSQVLKERMQGRTPIPYSRLQYHLSNPDKSDWVLAGVIVSKFIKTSQKGNPYACWTLSDLREGLQTVSIFLFGKAYKTLCKTSTHTVVAILNPTPLENRKTSSDIAALSVLNSDQVMIWGQSKDLGTCKARKKNGEPCTSIVNMNQCDYCIYHVKQEYRKFTARSELQAPSGGSMSQLKNKVLGKNEVFYAGKSYTATVGKPTKKQVVKDQKRLSQLFNQCESRFGPQTAVKAVKPAQSARVQLMRDAERLQKLTGSPATLHSLALEDKTETQTLLGKSLGNRVLKKDRSESDGIKRKSHNSDIVSFSEESEILHSDTSSSAKSKVLKKKHTEPASKVMGKGLPGKENPVTHQIKRELDALDLLFPEESKIRRADASSSAKSAHGEPGVLKNKHAKLVSKSIEKLLPEKETPVTHQSKRELDALDILFPDESKIQRAATSSSAKSAHGEPAILKKKHIQLVSKSIIKLLPEKGNPVTHQSKKKLYALDIISPEESKIQRADTSSSAKSAHGEPDILKNKLVSKSIVKRLPEKGYPVTHQSKKKLYALDIISPEESKILRADTSSSAKYAHGEPGVLKNKHPKQVSKSIGKGLPEKETPGTHQSKRELDALDILLPEESKILRADTSSSAKSVHGEPEVLKNKHPNPVSKIMGKGLPGKENPVTHESKTELDALDIPFPEESKILRADTSSSARSADEEPGVLQNKPPKRVSKSIGKGLPGNETPVTHQSKRELDALDILFPEDSKIRRADTSSSARSAHGEPGVLKNKQPNLVSKSMEKGLPGKETPVTHHSKRELDALDILFPEESEILRSDTSSVAKSFLGGQGDLKKTKPNDMKNETNISNKVVGNKKSSTKPIFNSGGSKPNATSKNKPTKNRFESLTKLKSIHTKSELSNHVTENQNSKASHVSQSPAVFDVCFEFDNKSESSSRPRLGKNTNTSKVINKTHSADLPRAVKDTLGSYTMQLDPSKESQGGSSPFVKKLFFPGGKLPTNHELRNTAYDLSNANLTKPEESKVESTSKDIDFECSGTRLKDLVHTNSPKLNEFGRLNFSVPLRQSAAKLKALKYVKSKGSILKEDPKEKKTIEVSGLSKDNKRKRTNKEEEEDNSKNDKSSLSKRFIELMNATSKHTDLISQAEDQEMEEYFNKTEKKEQMEEKMLNTYKIECKAVRCLKCKYKWFSASEKCKADNHPIKVISAVKRFFQCQNCKNRTVSLEIIPLHNCTNCGQGNWIRAPMMRERKSANVHLSIRGGEQKFTNSMVTDTNLDLLVPDD